MNSRKKLFLLIMPILLLASFFVSDPAAQAEQTILYQENFNDGQAAGWQEQADPVAVWQIKNGKYNLKISDYNIGASSIYQNGFSWQDYIFSFDAELNDGVDRNVIFRKQDDKNYYSLGLRGFWRYAPLFDTPVIYLARCYQGQCVGAEYSQYFVAYHFNDNRGALNNEISHIDIEAIGNRIKVYYNHNLVIDWQEPNDNYPKFGTIGFSGWSGDYGAADVSWDNLTVRTAWPEKPVAPEPVIIAPGIMGSWNISGKWELDPILHTYDNLWQALKNAGYEEGKSLFALPYQWRLSNGYTAELLKQKIQEVKAITGSNKVDIIGHSMGGLIARSYIQGNDYQNDIDQLIFLSTPHRGSTKAYLMWEGGEFGIKRNDLIMQRILTVEAEFNGYGSLFSYIKNLPMQSVQELLPIYDYLRDKDTMALRTYPNNYPVNNFLELLNNPFELQKLNGVRIINVLADAGASSTIENLRIINKEFNNGEWLNGYPENYSLPFTDHGLEYGPGDSTVPSKSNKDFAGLENIIISSDHGSIATDAQKRIIKELTGIEPTQEVRLNLFKKFFLVRIFSPADFIITAPNGQRLGKDFLNSQTINEIPAAFYSGFDTDAEFAVIPDPLDGDYKVELQGTGQGEYKLSVSLIDDSNQIDQEFNGNIALAQEQDFNINYSAASENPLSDLAPVDTVPPLITINKPIEAEKYLHSNSLVMGYTATDDFSGLATTSLMIDSHAVATTTIDLFDYSLGTHNLTITAVDKAGNQAQAQVSFEIIANIDSTISDIEKIHQRGWLTDKIYEKLLKKALKLLKIEAKYFSKERELNEKLIRKTQNDGQLTDKQKQKIIEQYNRKLTELKKNRQKAINRSLDSIIRLLDKAKDKGLLDQRGYDIIISDVDYLRNNL